MTDQPGADITTESSRRICKHMNEDHAASVVGMTLASLSKTDRGSKVSNVRLKNVSLDGCTLSFVTCRGDVCEMKQVTMPFEPPLRSASEIRPRLIAIHHKVLSPHVSWLFTEPLALTILVTCGILGYCVYAVDRETLISDLEGAKRLHEVIASIFGSASNFASMIYISWYFTVVAHASEAVYASYHCRKALKLGLGNTLLWFVLIALVGYPIMTKFSVLLNAQLARDTKDGKAH